MSVKISESASKKVLSAMLKRPASEHFDEFQKNGTDESFNKIQGNGAELAAGESVVVLAQLRREDFRLARVAISGVEKYRDYEDWLDARLALIFGLQISGLIVESIDIEVSMFLTWCRARLVSPNEQSLDLYAEHLFAGR